MHIEVAGLTRRFIAQATIHAQQPPAPSEALVLGPADRTVLLKLTHSEERILAEAGAMVFRLTIDAQGGPPCDQALQRMAEEYVFVARGLFAAMPQTAHLSLGVTQQEAKHLAELGVDDIARAAAEGRLRLTLRHDLEKLLRVFQKLGSAGQRRSFLVLNSGGGS